jgi:hypothetical protein
MEQTRIAISELLLSGAMPQVWGIIHPVPQSAVKSIFPQPAFLSGEASTANKPMTRGEGEPFAASELAGGWVSVVQHAEALVIALR